tara:strand:- start:1615 stop:2394 length:780 start_codon:yes stop_codon:yes gene_type:complete
MFSNKLKPVFSHKKHLIRIGPKRDGGYIVDNRIIGKIKLIVTCGLSDDWSFEKHFLKHNNKVYVHAYDHTVDTSYWINRFFKDILHLILFKKLSLWKIKSVFRYFDYIHFFAGHNRHFKTKISNKNVKDRSTTIEKILKDKKNILLKIDIEGSEYSILNDIIKNRKKITFLIIEFHSIKKNLNRIYKFISQMKDLKIIHIHGNNVNKIDKNGYPYALELSFLNSKIVDISKRKNLNHYPITGLDYPNVKRNEDIKLIFK